jgi:SAM-dependent methyltransferase
MAEAYSRGRNLRSADIAAWMAAAAPYLPHPSSDSGHVLDLGAGTGRFSAALADTCATTARSTRPGFAGPVVIACEPSTAMRVRCRSNCPPAIGVVAGTAGALPFRSGTFDAVWASQVIHHIDDLPTFARDLRRVLKPGGHLLLRGGFGPPDAIPLYRYFPAAWAATVRVALPLARITELLADAGIRQVAHSTVEQTFAADPDELLAKVRTRSLSHLAALPDAKYHAGLRLLESDAQHGRLTGPIRERLDLVVFRAAS